MNLRRLALISLFAFSTSTLVAGLLLPLGAEIDRTAEWTGTSSPGSNWSYFTCFDNDGNPTDGYKSESNWRPMVWRANAFGISNLGYQLPSIATDGMFFNDNVPTGYKRGVNRFWGIMAWTSDQDGLTLDIEGRLRVWDGFAPNSNQVELVFGIFADGALSELFHRTVVPANETGLTIGADELHLGGFNLDRGDKFFLAGRITQYALQDRNDFIGVDDRQLRFRSVAAVPEPSVLLTALSAISLTFLMTKRERR